MTSNRRNLLHIQKPLICIYTNQNRNEFAIGTKSILQPYETLPLILNNNNGNNPVSDLIFEDTTSLFPECSVKYKEVKNY